MKEYQFFRLSTAPDFSPCLQQHYRRGAIQCRFGRIASGAAHWNGIFLREFLRQLADLFENRGLSLNFFRAIWGEREREGDFILVNGVVLNLHSNKNLIVSKKFHKNFLWEKKLLEYFSHWLEYILWLKCKNKTRRRVSLHYLEWEEISSKKFVKCTHARERSIRFRYIAVNLNGNDRRTLSSFSPFASVQFSILA